MTNFPFWVNYKYICYPCNTYALLTLTIQSTVSWHLVAKLLLVECIKWAIEIKSYQKLNPVTRLNVCFNGLTSTTDLGPYFNDLSARSKVQAHFRIRFCLYNDGKTDQRSRHGLWSKRVVPVLLISNGCVLGYDVQ